MQLMQKENSIRSKFLHSHFVNNGFSIDIEVKNSDIKNLNTSDS